MYKRFERNKVGNDYVVGDIHGCYSLLEKELKEIGFDENVDRLFSVGDLIDRGTENHRSIEFLEKPWFYAIKGNHEDMIVKYFFSLKNEKEHMKDMMIHNGASWFIDLKLEEQEEYAWTFAELKLYFEVDIIDNKRVGIVHADCYHNNWDINVKELLSDALSDHRKIEDYALWNRTRINLMDKSIIKNIDFVVHGHTPLKQIVILGNRFYIDTGACFGHRLTILKLNDLIQMYDDQLKETS